MADEKDFREQEGCSEEACAGCEHADSCPSKNGPESFLEEQNRFSNIKKVIGVVSGKGGVGKSFVTGSLAVELAKKGYKVGILDADITGPSIQKMFGIKGHAEGSEDGIFPRETASGIRIISVNMLLEDEETPVMHTSIVILITSLLEMAGTKKLQSDVLFRYAKTGLTKISLTETALLCL